MDPSSVTSFLEGGSNFSPHAICRGLGLQAFSLIHHLGLVGWVYLALDSLAGFSDLRVDPCIADCKHSSFDLSA